jgi:uncharacterized protein YlaI
VIHIGCNLCKRIIAADDRDAVREGVNGEGVRVDVCGSCMREAAERVADRLRALVRVVDPMPESVRSRALSIRLPEHLTRRR